MKKLDKLIQNELEKQTGVVFQGALPNSPAAKSGLKEGDVIISINGQPIYSLDDCVKVFNSKDKKLVVEVARNETVFLELVIEK